MASGLLFMASGLQNLLHIGCWQAQYLARTRAWFMLVAGTVYLEHDLAQVCGRHSTWNMTWLKFVAGTVLGTGLGSSWWQAQYLEEDLAQVAGRHTTWKRTWLELLAGPVYLEEDLAPVVACTILCWRKAAPPGSSKDVFFSCILLF